MKNITVVKASGEKEIFAPEKLYRSLKRAGAAPGVCDEIVSHIMGELQQGMSTTHIYRHAFSLLRKTEARPVAARYSLRRAVFGLGPTGFPFEEYVAEVFRAKGYIADTGMMIQGKCAEHEVDVVMYNEREHIGAELKFHNNLGMKTDLKVALYVKERFDDIKKGKQRRGVHPYIEQGMLITNTKFTHSAINYGKCSGLRMIGWNYPRKGNLEDIIEETGVYPITTLTTLSKKDKVALIEGDVVTCTDLSEKEDQLLRLGVPKSKIATVVEESQALCSLHETEK